MIPQMEPNFDEKEANAVYEYMMSGGWVTEHKKSRELEKMICDYTGSKYAHLVNNGTISLSLALLAVGVKPGDKVIVPNLTMIATPNSVRLIGAEPVFVDVEDKTGCISVHQVNQKLQDRDISAVFHVSLNARCNDILSLKKLCNTYSIPLIEDSAQSLGSFYLGQHLGTFGDIGSFSFSSPKIISTGQGGVLVTNDKELSEKIWRLKNFGRDSGGNDDHPFFGINCKFTDLQAVVGIEQMKKLPERVSAVRKNWELYRELLLSEVDIIDTREEKWIPWFIDIYLPTEELRDKLHLYLKEKEIGTRKLYPPITSQKIYQDEKDTFPISEDLSRRGLWLPSSTKLTEKQIRMICDQIIKFCGENIWSY
jgi:perosamine synthetase